MLDAEPGLVVGAGLHGLQAGLAVVGRRRLLVVLVRVAQHQPVVAQVERVAVQRHRVQEHVRVAALGLARRAAVVVPHGQF